MSVTMKVPSYTIGLAACVGFCLTSARGLGQSAQVPSGVPPQRGAALPGAAAPGRAVTPMGRNPDAGAQTPENSLAPAQRDDRPDSELIFSWMEPFSWLLSPQQVDGLRVSIREHLNEMRMLEDRRKRLKAEIFIAAIKADAKAPGFSEKAVALGQVEVDLATRRAEILKNFQPSPTPEQREQMRGVLVKMFERGEEPFSFVQNTESIRSALQRLNEELRTDPGPSPVPYSRDTRLAPQPPAVRPAPLAPGR
jgi:hypothetical protein